MQRLKIVHILSLSLFLLLFFAAFASAVPGTPQDKPGNEDAQQIDTAQIDAAQIGTAQQDDSAQQDDGAQARQNDTVQQNESAQQIDQDAAPSPDASVADTSTQDAGAQGTPPPVLNSSVVGHYNSNEVASKAVEKNLGFFSTRIKDKFSLWLSRSGKYLELMKEILKKKNVPEDMVFLSLIESGFNPYAYSMARAVGPWQFIASTAKRYGLVINWWKDERRDPVKSTAAAADYLKDLYGMFGSWNLAMAAYNAGEGKILKALRKSNTDDYWDLLGTKQIKSETKDYVPKFIAASLIASNPKDFGFDNIDYNQPLKYDEVEIDSPIDLSVAAECAGTDVDVIKKLNPELRRWCTPPDASQYTLRIPEGTKDAFLKKLAAIPDDERFTIDRYKVKRGDTFRKIARKTGIPKSVIFSLNATEKILPLRTGSLIYLPPKGMFRLDADDKAFAKKVSFVRKISHGRRKLHYKRWSHGRHRAHFRRGRAKKRVFAARHPRHSKHHHRRRRGRA